jgi:hypothetical protein
MSVPPTTNQIRDATAQYSEGTLNRTHLRTLLEEYDKKKKNTVTTYLLVAKAD